MSRDQNSACPCGSSQLLDKCCGPFLRNEKRAVTAEQLMRSRFTAFSLGVADYLVATLAPERRTPNERKLLESELRKTRWLKLEILATESGQPEDQMGTVEFNAYFIQPSGAGCLHERSNFRREGERWFYVDGSVEIR